MRMMRSIMTLVVAVMLVHGARPVSAHDDFRIIGTISVQETSKIQVKDRDGRTTWVALNKQTSITRDKKKVPATELKVGRSVVVDAYGDSEADLLAIDVRIVPAITAGSAR